MMRRTGGSTRLPTFSQIWHIIKEACVCVQCSSSYPLYRLSHLHTFTLTLLVGRQEEKFVGLGAPRVFVGVGRDFFLFIHKLASREPSCIMFHHFCVQPIKRQVKIMHKRQNKQTKKTPRHTLMDDRDQLKTKTNRPRFSVKWKTHNNFVVLN